MAGRSRLPCGDQSKLITVANNVPNLSSEAATAGAAAMPQG